MLPFVTAIYLGLAYYQDAIKANQQISLGFLDSNDSSGVHLSIHNILLKIRLFWLRSGLWWVRAKQGPKALRSTLPQTPKGCCCWLRDRPKCAQLHCMQSCYSWSYYSRHPEHQQRHLKPMMSCSGRHLSKQTDIWEWPYRFAAFLLLTTALSSKHKLPSLLWSSVRLPCVTV